MTRIHDTTHPRRKHIAHRLTSGIFFNIHRIDRDGALGRLIGSHIGIIIIVAPFASHQFECGKSQMGGFLKIRHKHTDKSNGGEIVDRPHSLFVVAQGDTELIPHDGRFLAVACSNGKFLFVDDIIFAHLQIFRADRDAILEVALIFIERVVLVDIFHIGHTSCRLIERIGSIGLRKRIALGAIVMLIALKNRLVLLIEIVAAIEVIIVATGVVDGREGVLLHFCDCGIGQDATQRLHIIAISRKFFLLVGG